MISSPVRESRFCDNGARDCDALLLPSGKLGWLMLSPPAQANAFQSFLHPLFALRIGHALIDEGELYIFFGSHL